MRIVLFHRHFKRFKGGHLKVWDYFNHVLHSRGWRPRVEFSARTTWDATNPWYGSPPDLISHAGGTDLDPDVLFLAGVDWRNLSEPERERPAVPVINLIQHVRHATPDDPRYPFLAHPAIRVCVSEEVTEAISSTGRVNGPVFTIPNGVDLGGLRAGVRPDRRDLDLLVVAGKRPDVGRRIALRLGGEGRIRLLDEIVPRDALLELVSRARVTVFLPNPTEGFYLPALEGMVLGTGVVCPDCVGNRSFCLDGENCLRPGYDEDELVAAAVALLRDVDRRDRLVQAAHATAERHDLERERVAFLDILDRVDELWAAL
jgi:glycosyltransferase involved in cell wall biosynthesis